MKWRRIGIGLAGAAAAATLLGVAYRFDPQDSAFPYPRCLFRTLTGWDCPGCGSARALHALLHGDFAAAWAFNPALPAIAAAGLAALAIEAFGSPGLRRAAFSPVAVAALLAAIIFWTVYRNL